jgi:hypothetical protein
MQTYWVENPATTQTMVWNTISSSSSSTQLLLHNFHLKDFVARFVSENKSMSFSSKVSKTWIRTPTSDTCLKAKPSQRNIIPYFSKEAMVLQVLLAFVVLAIHGSAAQHLGEKMQLQPAELVSSCAVSMISKGVLQLIWILLQGVDGLCLKA